MTSESSKAVSPVGAAENTVAGAKRKRNGEQKFYAVKAGFQPGVYNKWSDCLVQVTGFKDAVCKLDHSHQLLNFFLFFFFSFIFEILLRRDVENYICFILITFY